MSEQQSTLFDSPRIGSHRKHDPETSKQAARSVDATSLEMHVVIQISMYGPMTTRELSERLHDDLVTISPRIAPLVRKGILRDSGERRKGPSGRNSIVWSLAQ